MPPRFPEEVDVFSVPHSRMKYLVKSYLNQLSTLDFSDADAMSCFLSSLLDTFQEFKQHEQIENRFIMDRLKRRLSALSVYNSAVCNCHQDNRLTEMLEMVRDGLAGWHGPEAERDGFRCLLRRKLEDFTDNFLPHMEEEEEIFQPLLIKYFGYDELRELKQDVLQKHRLTEKTDLPEKPAPVDVPARPLPAPEDLPERPLPVPRLPPEVLTLVFSHLRPEERARCAAVCRAWRAATLAPSLWTSLRPDRHPPQERASSEPDVVEELMLESRLEKSLDLDADIDECDLTVADVWSGKLSRAVIYQRRLLKSLTSQTLPLVGQYVQTLVLSGWRGLGSTQLRQLLVHCTGIRHLDVSYTPVGDCSFKRLPPASLQRLEHCDLTGCDRLSDRAVERLAGQLDLLWPPAVSVPDDIEDAGAELPDPDCYDCESHEGCGAAVLRAACRLARDKNGRPLVPAGGAGARLLHLSLSGCHRVTSAGVARLAACRAAGFLRLLDVSGCDRVSGAALRALAAAAPRLQPERLWYCDRVADGPHPQLANGCDNVECPIRRCCRN